MARPARIGNGVLVAILFFGWSAAGAAKTNETAAADLELAELKLVVNRLRLENERLQRELASNQGDRERLQSRLGTEFSDRADRQPGLTSAAVVGVNPTLGVAVLAIGREQGVRVGMRFEILRDRRRVQELTVVEVRTRVCAAAVSGKEDGIKVERGDMARVIMNMEGVPD